MQLIAEMSWFTVDMPSREVSAKNAPMQREQATATAADSETVVLGGKINQTSTTTDNKVPWLSDLPGIGDLFRFRTQTIQRTQLLIFVTPHIVRNRADADRFRVRSERIKKGMTPDQVRAIMGCPAGFYCCRESIARNHHMNMMLPVAEGGKVGVVQRWVGDKDYIIVDYIDGKVVDAQNLEGWWNTPPAEDNRFAVCR